MTADAALERRFLDLVERNRDRIARLCRTWSWGAAEAEDLRSEIVLQLWRSIGSFDGRSSVDTWLYRVALNTAMLAGRQRGRQRDGADRYEQAAPQPDPGPDAGERLDTDRRLERLERAIRGLDPADRALITLHLEELPHAQIAEVLGIGAGNVGVRLHRVRKRLGRLLADEEAR